MIDDEDDQGLRLPAQVGLELPPGRPCAISACAGVPVSAASTSRISTYATPSARMAITPITATKPIWPPLSDKESLTPAASVDIQPPDQRRRAAEFGWKADFRCTAGPR